VLVNTYWIILSKGLQFVRICLNFKKCTKRLSLYKMWLEQLEKAHEQKKTYVYFDMWILKPVGHVLYFKALVFSSVQINIIS